MEKGKFEAPKGKKSVPRRNDQNMTVRRKESVMSRIWPVLAAVAGVLVLVVGILILTEDSRNSKKAGATNSTVEFAGMPRADLERRFTELDMMIRKDLVLTLTPELKRGETAEEPLVLTLSDAVSDVHLDLVQLTADLNAGKGREDANADSYVLDPRDYLVFSEDSLRAEIEEFVAQNASEYAESAVKLEDAPKEMQPTESQKPSEEEEEQPVEELPPAKLMTVHTGSVGRKLDAKEIYRVVTDSYALALIAEKPEEVMQPKMSYELEVPSPVDIETLWKRFCKDPVEPELDVKTGEVTDGENGFGFDREELQAMLEAAKPSEEVQILLTALKPQMDAETLRNSLFQDVLAEAHTDHTANYNRTNNLKLACEAMDGTIVLPGEEFSFNRTVGQRTEAKGYREALVYTGGGQSKPEVGGGVCQVASSIYYAVLQADLETTERAAHMFLVDYVPFGMDATVYWGSLDYKFRNNSPYPIKIESSVHDGQVHVVLYGTEWKDYTVELDYQILSRDAWETVEKEVPDDGTYYNGEVITTPYTGYRVKTFKTTKNKKTGEEKTTEIAVSQYNRRDRVIAKLEEKPTEPSETDPTESTEPSSEATEPSSEATEPSSEATEPSSEATEPSSEATEPSSDPEPEPSSDPEPEPEPSEGGDD